MLPASLQAATARLVRSGGARYWLTPSSAPITLSTGDQLEQAAGDPIRKGPASGHAHRRYIAGPDRQFSKLVRAGSSPCRGRLGSTSTTVIWPTLI